MEQNSKVNCVFCEKLLDEHSTNQLKTLVVMQVLGNSKSFFESQQQINDRVGFFTDTTLPDSYISDNNIASYLLFGGSNQLMNEMIDSQWQK